MLFLNDSENLLFQPRAERSIFMDAEKLNIESCAGGSAGKV